MIERLGGSAQHRLDGYRNLQTKGCLLIWVRFCIQQLSPRVALIRIGSVTLVRDLNAWKNETWKHITLRKQVSGICWIEVRTMLHSVGISSDWFGSCGNILCYLDLMLHMIEVSEFGQFPLSCMVVCTIGFVDWKFFGLNYSTKQPPFCCLLIICHELWINQDWI